MRGDGRRRFGGSRRVTWPELPAHVRAGIERRLGHRVVAAASQPFGFSTGLAARLRLDNARRVFVKAIDTAAHPAVGEFHRREIVVAGALPAAVPAPRLLEGLDDLDGGTWVALLFEDIDGWMPAQPWRPDELVRVLAAVTELAELLTPGPDLTTPPRLPRLGGWARLAANPAGLARLRVAAPRAVDELPAHLELENRLAEVIEGETLAHGDLYPSNVLITADRVVFVDWPHAWTGPKHADLVTLLSSVAFCGGDPEPYAAGHRLLAGMDRDAVDVLISAQAGFLLASACSPAPAADPRLVATMTDLGLASLRWLAGRRGRISRERR